MKYKINSGEPLTWEGKDKFYKMEDEWFLSESLTLGHLIFQ
jgi:hypothetical protein